MKFSIAHNYNVSAQTLWDNLFNPELEASVKKATKLDEFTVVNEEQGDTLVRKVRVLPNVEMPGALRKVLGDQIGYREEDRVPKNGKMEYSWSAVPDRMADKVKMAGIFRVEPTGENTCRRVIEGDVTVKIFGIGGLAEKFVVGELEKSYAVVAQSQERWIKDNA